MSENIEKRMIGSTGYEVKHSVRIGDREILIAENMNDPVGFHYIKAEYSDNGIIGQYDSIMQSSCYLSVMEAFTAGIDRQTRSLRAEYAQSDFQHSIITPEQCHPNDYGQDITGEIVAIKPSVLRPEYRRGDQQLVFVTHGSGALANPRGAGVYCYHLSDGKQARFERQDVQGVIKELPRWAKEQLDVLQAEREAAKEPKGFENDGQYTITERIKVGKTSFVLGENSEAPSPFVTWQHVQGLSGKSTRRYFGDRDKAMTDLQSRADNERADILSGKSRRLREREHAR